MSANTSPGTPTARQSKSMECGTNGRAPSRFDTCTPFGSKTEQVNGPPYIKKDMKNIKKFSGGKRNQEKKTHLYLFPLIRDFNPPFASFVRFKCRAIRTVDVSERTF